MHHQVGVSNTTNHEDELLVDIEAAATNIAQDIAAAESENTTVDQEEARTTSPANVVSEHV